MKKAYIGIDAGGTTIAAGLVDRQGHIFKFVSYPSEVKKGKNHIVKIVLNIVEDFLKEDIKCLGISLAWPQTVNMQLSGQEIKKVLSKKYKYKIILNNDANLFTLGETLLGQGRKHKTVVGITLGTGVGCGLVIDKKIYLGKSQGSEFGHVSINFKGPRCACGNNGCIEEYVGSRALKRLAKKYNIKNTQGEELYKLAKQGNKKALKLWQEFGKYLGFALLSVINSYDPSVIILSGQISKAHKFFIQEAKKEIKNRELLKSPPIKISKLKNAAISVAPFVLK